MTDRLRIVAAQLNPVAGDLAVNAAAAVEATRRAAALDPPADIVLFPEMFLTGYQLGDMVRRSGFGRDCMSAMTQLVKDLPEDGPAVLIGGVHVENGATFNAMTLIEEGAIRTVFKKHHFPNDGVFDEERLFTAGPAPGPVMIRGARIAVPICEDLWHTDVAETLEEAGAEIFLVPNGSPYERGKHDQRVHEMVKRVVETDLPLLYLNFTGGQDDQVFDGGMFVLNPGGQLAVQAPWFDEVLILTDWTRDDDGWRCAQGERAPALDDIEADYRAMVEATGDFVRKSGFERVVLGLSGGIDSALVAAVAADALGPDNVWCVMLPSVYTSDSSLEDASACAAALGAPLLELPIADPVAAVETALEPVFAGRPADASEENIQSRMRGLMLMALSNKTGALLLTTGNKSEVAVGYSTLYGDMCGAYNPLKDMYKTRVFETARWRNAQHRPWMRAPAGPVIPNEILTKPPSAELRPDQKDSDSLPDYDVLDEILEMLIEDQESVKAIVDAGHDRDTVLRVQNLLYAGEHKRFQSAPGVKLTKRAFWLDRRYPIVNRWRDGS